MSKKKEQATANVETMPTPQAPAAPAVQAKASHKAWSGVLRFGPIPIPVALLTASREDRISFRQLHADCHHPIKQQKVCSVCTANNGPAVLADNQIVKGFEYQKDHFCIMGEGDIENAKPDSEKVMEFLEYVPADDVDPIYFESASLCRPWHPVRPGPYLAGWRPETGAEAKKPETWTAALPGL